MGGAEEEESVRGVCLGVDLKRIWLLTLSSAEVSSWPPGCWAGLLCVGSGRGVVLSEEFLLCDEASEEARSTVWCMDFGSVELGSASFFSSSLMMM